MMSFPSLTNSSLNYLWTLNNFSRYSVIFVRCLVCFYENLNQFLTKYFHIYFDRNSKQWRLKLSSKFQMFSQRSFFETLKLVISQGFSHLRPEISESFLIYFTRFYLWGYFSACGNKVFNIQQHKYSIKIQFDPFLAAKC
jgi:hypothetical protein